MRRAISLADDQFPGRSSRQLADQIGCSQQYVAKVREQVFRVTPSCHPDRVTGHDGNQYPAVQSSTYPKFAAVDQALQDGWPTRCIATELHVGHYPIANIRRELGATTSAKGATRACAPAAIRRAASLIRAARQRGRRR